MLTILSYKHLIIEYRNEYEIEPFPQSNIPDNYLSVPKFTHLPNYRYMANKRVTNSSFPSFIKNFNESLGYSILVDQMLC